MTEFTYRDPSARGQNSMSAEASVVDRNSHFNGIYRSKGDLRIEGTVEGEIECDGTVTVAQDASVTASVHARNVVIAGSASGEITCQESFTVQSTGQMRGKAQAGTLVVEEGAFFEGEFRMGDGSSRTELDDFDRWGVSEESNRESPAFNRSSPYERPAYESGGYDSWSSSLSADRSASTNLFGEDTSDRLYDEEETGDRPPEQRGGEDELDEDSF
jgi:cytoskeletal protein CcmA (bactofilin family)